MVVIIVVLVVIEVVLEVIVMVAVAVMDFFVGSTQTECLSV